MATTIVFGFLSLLAPAEAQLGATSGVPELARTQDFTAHRVSSTNADPLSNDDSLRPIPGETVVLADLEGPGVVNHIWLTVAAADYGWPRLLRLRIYYDGSPVPSVDAPVGDFFGVGLGLESPLESLAIRDSSSGRSRNSYWPMPFARSCRITVTNEGSRRVSNLYYHVDYRKVPELPAETRYFHARYHQELPVVAGRFYPVLEIAGEGHYVGTVFSVVQAEPGWFGEGDEWIFVDGAAEPSIIGTGTEDYFNDAWSLRVDTGPYAGVTVAEGTGLGARMSAYRWHLLDPIPFRSQLRFVFEHNGWTFTPDGSVRSASGERADLFSSVAFWYQKGVALNRPPVPYGPARLPHGNATQFETEDVLAAITAKGGTVTVLPELFWGKDVVLFKAEGPGARMDVPFNVETVGRYELSVQTAHSFDYGDYRTLLDGKPTVAAEIEHEPGATVLGNEIHAYHHETYVGADHFIGWFDLAAGDHVLSFVCTGRDSRSSGYGLGIDNVVLARTGREVWPGEGGLDEAAETILAMAEYPEPILTEQLPALAAALGAGDAQVRRAALQVLIERGQLQAVPVLLFGDLLSDPDPEVRGLAAVALRDLGPSGEAVMQDLIAALSDPDENVRIAAADAIATKGPTAIVAIPALVRACQVKGEEVHVQRSLVSALGAIGPPAREALPVLRELAQIPRVSWPAEAAILEIEGPLKY
ncbi:MAG: DUF2961 domain-containing protein [Acidobacteriota bacterium]|nr:DUF2961 domain-containing protein [Acidobacteriota bacterium]